MITQKLVKELFNYKDGNLYWKSNQGSNKVKGNKAGSLHSTGYYQIKINQKLYKTHRIIYLYHHGFLPKYVDHIDRDPINNKIENLREVTQSQNIMNSKSNKNTSSIYKGVSWSKRSNKWRVYIHVNGNAKYLGLFTNEIKAAIIYNNAAIKYFGKYAYLNEVK